MNIFNEIKRKIKRINQNRDESITYRKKKAYI